MQDLVGDKFAPIKGRVRMYLKYKGFSQRKFLREAQVADSTFKGKPALSEFGGEILAKVAMMFPDLSTRWLLTGVGAMEAQEIRSSNSTQENYITGDNNILTSGYSYIKAQSPKRQDTSSKTEEQTLTLLVEQCAQKDLQISAKDEQIKLLSDMLSQAQKTIHTLIAEKTKSTD